MFGKHSAGSHSTPPPFPSCLRPKLSAVRSPRRREAPAPSSGTPIAVESKSPRWGGPDHSEFAGLRAGMTGARAAARRGLESLRAERPRETWSAPGVPWGPPSPGPPVVISVKQEEGKQGQKEPPSRSSLRFCPHARLPAHLSWG
ncbi:PREDICTED: F-box and leucine-rich protein 22-like [Cercocebus atys]|uniref:F-box and leucine-rich protein 22-like n=1 Tax=Cercocebus atys TaxID=9531 RepID=UPI0005F3B075|nr:PREDICTED: F-box and leucine-rich protein 22-like [Cercocebus atys]